MMESKLALSAMTLGTAQIGGHYGIANHLGQPSEKEANDLLQAAWEGGITCYDTARAYGNSEDRLGKYFNSDQIPVVITKVNLSGKMPPQLVHSEVFKQLHESLRRLQLKQVPILMLHGVLISDECWQAALKALKECVQEGLAAYIGLSCSVDTQSLQNLMTFANDPIIRYVQIPVNLADQRPILFDTLTQLHNRGIEVFARSVFLQGLLLLNEEQIAEELQEIIPLIRKIRSYSKETGCSLQQILITYVRDMKEIHSLVIGAETMDQVRNNLAFIAAPPLDPYITNIVKNEAAVLSETVLNPANWKHQAVFK